LETPNTLSSPASSASVCGSLFEYDNYRTFLRDYFEEQRLLKPQFSLRFFALKAGFSSHSFCYNLIKGTRNLSLDSLPGILHALGLRGVRAKYFKALVLFNQATDVSLRDQYLHELMRYRASQQFSRISADQYAYFATWYMPVIRELAVHGDWRGDFRRLGSLLRPAISGTQAREAIETMLRIGILELQSDGFYRQTDAVVTAEGVPGQVYRSVRTEFMLRAIEASENLPPSERHTSCAAVAMSRSSYEAACVMLDEVRKDILAIASQDPVVEGVYCVSVQAFPLLASQLPPRRKK